MTPSEFEERAYEAPLYNQLERKNSDVFTPGQVLENLLGFDRGVFFAQDAIWKTLGYKRPPLGAALAYYDWPFPFAGLQLPRFRLNLFLQAKRPFYYSRKPRSLRSIDSVDAPLWAFRVTEHQQLLLEALAEKTGNRAHVAYASAAFHTYAALFGHTRERTIVENSTFPSVVALAGHEAWYYQRAGAEGTANPNPENIREQPLLDRVRAIARQTEIDESRNLAWLNSLAVRVIDSVRTSEGALSAQYFDDLHTLDRLADSYDLLPSLRAYAQISLFTIRFDINWLVITDAS